MTRAEIEAKAREAVADIELENDISHGAATNWCPEYAQQRITAALLAAVEAERAACVARVRHHAAAHAIMSGIGDANAISGLLKTVADDIAARRTAGEG